MYGDIDARAQEFACEVGINVEIARIFTSRIPVKCEEKSSNRKEDNYLKIWHILDQIANLRGLLDIEFAVNEFKPSLKEGSTADCDSIQFKRFAVFEIALGMKFPHEVKKSDLSDAEVSALYSWLAK